MLHPPVRAAARPKGGHGPAPLQAVAFSRWASRLILAREKDAARGPVRLRNEPNFRVVLPDAVAADDAVALPDTALVLPRILRADIAPITEFDPDEVLGFMTSEEAAVFLGIPYSSFREIAPNLPRHAITPARYGYLRRELLAWGRER
jgi:hypothetical protein